MNRWRYRVTCRPHEQGFVQIAGISKGKPNAASPVPTTVISALAQIRLPGLATIQHPRYYILDSNQPTFISRLPRSRLQANKRSSLLHQIASYLVCEISLTLL